MYQIIGYKNANSFEKYDDYLEVALGAATETLESTTIDNNLHYRAIKNQVCHAPLLEECPQHHGHKGDPGVTPGTCGAIGERAQVILVWVRALGRWERLPPMETKSHEG